MAVQQGATVLVVGSTGSIGRHVVAVAAGRGLRVRAMVRDLDRGAAALPGVGLVRADLLEPISLGDALRGVGAIVLAQGVSGGESPERTDYQGIRHVLAAFGDATPRLAMMTALYVTRREHFLNEQFDHVLNWRRRAERLVRASGLPAIGGA